MGTGLYSQINAMVHAMDISTWGEKCYYISFVAPYQIYCNCDCQDWKKWFMQWALPHSCENTTKNHLAKIIRKLDPIFKIKFHLLIHWFIWLDSVKIFSPPIHTFMKNNEHPKTYKVIICINILIFEPFLTHYWPNFWLFFKNVLTFIY
jgi:hypothetical protein